MKGAVVGAWIGLTDGSGIEVDGRREDRIGAVKVFLRPRWGYSESR